MKSQQNPARPGIQSSLETSASSGAPGSFTVPGGPDGEQGPSEGLWECFSETTKTNWGLSVSIKESLFLPRAWKAWAVSSATCSASSSAVITCHVPALSTKDGHYIPSISSAGPPRLYHCDDSSPDHWATVVTITTTAISLTGTHTTSSSPATHRPGLGLSQRPVLPVTRGTQGISQMARHSRPMFISVMLPNFSPTEPHQHQSLGECSDYVGCVCSAMSDFLRPHGL